MIGAFSLVGQKSAAPVARTGRVPRARLVPTTLVVSVETQENHAAQAALTQTKTAREASAWIWAMVRFACSVDETSPDAQRRHIIYPPRAPYIAIPSSSKSTVALVVLHQIPQCLVMWTRLSQLAHSATRSRTNSTFQWSSRLPLLVSGVTYPLLTSTRRSIGRFLLSHWR